jgi:hypothetical protein
MMTEVADADPSADRLELTRPIGIVRDQVMHLRYDPRRDDERVRCGQPKRCPQRGRLLRNCKIDRHRPEVREVTQKFDEMLVRAGCTNAERPNEHFHDADHRDDRWIPPWLHQLIDDMHGKRRNRLTTVKSTREGSLCRGAVFHRLGLPAPGSRWSLVPGRPFSPDVLERLLIRAVDPGEDARIATSNRSKLHPVGLGLVNFDHKTVAGLQTEQSNDLFREGSIDSSDEAALRARRSPCHHPLVLAASILTLHQSSDSRRGSSAGATFRRRTSSRIR